MIRFPQLRARRPADTLRASLEDLFLLVERYLLPQRLEEAGWGSKVESTYGKTSLSRK